MLKPPCATDAPGDANLRIARTPAAPRPGARTRRPDTTAHWLHRSLDVTPPELEKPTSLFNFIFIGETPATGYWYRIVARRVARGAVAERRLRNADEAVTRSRRGVCEENVPSQWRLVVYRLLTGVLPVHSSRRDFTTGTDTSQAPTLHKHRDRDTHAVRCTRSHTEARTCSDACLSLSGLRVLPIHTHPLPSKKQCTQRGYACRRWGGAELTDWRAHDGGKTCTILCRWKSCVGWRIRRACSSSAGAPCFR